jgi:hypothetical protein
MMVMVVLVFMVVMVQPSRIVAEVMVTIMVAEFV